MSNKNKIILIFLLITFIFTSLILFTQILTPDFKHFEKLFTIILINTLSAFSIFALLINSIFFNHKMIKEKNEEIKALKEKNDSYLNRYHYAIEGTTDGLWDWNLETDQVYFSRNWKKMIGYEDNEIENKLEEWEVRVHPDDKEHAIKDILDNNNKVTDYYQNTHRLRHKDGSWIWILDRGKTYFNKKGKAIRMVGFHSNITELRNLEINLADTKQELNQLKMVVDRADIGIIITDIQGEMVYVNPCICRVSGFKKEELIGKNPRILKFKEDSNDEKYSDLWSTIIRKRIWGGIFRNRKKDGNEYWQTATIIPIIDKHKNISNYLGITREITKEVYLEKQLRENEELMLSQSKNAAMGEMISMIAHQWRQPITTISMNANNIIADIELETFNENEIKNIAEDISIQTQFLSNTIDDFRNFFKTDKEVNDFEVKSLFDELSRIILPSLANNNISFNINCESKIRIRTYKRELLQVLLNIVKNAKEAFSQRNINNKENVITIVVEGLDDKVNIIISDNAGGIPEDIIDQIFEPYFTTKEEFNGTGLGLYMSKIIVEQHLDGILNVRNRVDGAKFTITLHNLKAKTT